MRIFFLILFLVSVAFSQVEHVHLYHPIYNYLLRLESKGYLENYSLADLPMQRNDIIDILKNVDEDDLSNSEKSTLQKFKKEFEIADHENRVLIYSDTDKKQVMLSPLFQDYEKFLYKQQGDYAVSIKPLGNLEYRSLSGNTEGSAVLGNAGVRIYGTLDSMLGYQLQVTNGTVLAGDRDILLADQRLGQNIKFTVYDSDFDFTESHLRFQKDWFYAYIGREYRQIGSGLNQRLIMSDAAPPMDAFAIGAKFENFEYKHTHASLLSLPIDSLPVTGIDSRFIDKYLVIHRASFRPSWGEISLWEQIVYTDRGFDLAYLNPFSFLKSVEHALRDRDNAVQGFDLTIRPIKNLQIKGTYLLDDIIFSEIGNGFWSNKSAYNLAIISSLPYGFDLGAEYSRNEPYVFSHFDNQQSLTNDGVLFSGYTPPNSENFNILIQKWYGNRFPIRLNLNYFRHGENITENGELIRNVGGNPLETLRRGIDSETVTFLDGNLVEVFSADLDLTFEIVRGFNMQLLYRFEKQNGLDPLHYARIGIRFDEFR